MQIIEDSRQQEGRHRNVASWMRAHGVDFAPRARALPFGDYMRDGSNISVDTKQSLDELAGNLGKQHRRFSGECRRSIAAGYRLVILTEAGARYSDPSEIAGWVGYACRKCGLCDPLDPSSRCSKYKAKPMTGARMLPIMASMERKYGTHFYFCDRRDTARTICEILGVRYHDE